MGADIFGTPASYYQNPEMPTLNAWMISQAVGDGAKATAVRNPYYWKVDPDGSQLPYVDQVSISIISSPEVMTLKAQSGEIDMQAAFFNTLTNKPVLADAGQSGGYHLFDVTPASMNAMILALNLNHRNATRRSMFQNKDFRIGLSHAINRQEIIDTVMAGQGEPWQAAPRKESALYDEEFAKQYTEFSVDKANEYLDRAGLSKKDSDGMRLGEDGRPISFNVEFQTTYPEHGSALEMIKDYWAAVGITMRPKPDGESLFTSRKESNLIDAVMEPEGQGLLYDVLLEPNPYMPFGDESSYALRWGDWAIGFDVGEQPPAVVKEQLALYNKAMATADLDQQITTMKELMRVAKSQFWQLGIVVPTGAYGIARNAIRNVPKQMFTGGDFCDPGPTNPETYYYA
jgi:peptide/nickel transport system substrate-binding protein